MKIQVLDNTFYRRPYITKPLDYITFQTTSNAYFDKDGYELNKLEQEFYKINGINIGLDQQYHKACQIEWFSMDLECFGIYTDHCMLVQRMAYDGYAKDQIERYVRGESSAGKDIDKTYRKLLEIRPKYGLDISLDYIDDHHCFELLHYEADFFDIDQALEYKEKAESLLLDTDWKRLINKVIGTKDEWSKLNSDDQSDYKAQIFGFKRAFDNLKVIGI